ncbi:MAG: hypothetical protein N5P05_004140 (plasmid) [Chroococcopsis gigantea SAG 12.99]|jgi:hypothetical protein|nr:hypothetical protein [Chroococcopsis gigantea SAG 12.99]
MIDQLFWGGNFIGKILDQFQEEERRKHQQKMQELSIIADSSLRDQLAAELLLERFLAPIEQAQYQIHDAAKHAQYMAEVIGFHYRDHGLRQEQANEVCKQFRFLAIQLTEVNSLYDLKLLYKAVTMFSEQISVFKHRERKYTIENEIRKGILDRLNGCIANYQNFQRRTAIMGGAYAEPNMNNTRFLGGL